MAKINFHNIDCIEFMKTKPDKHYDLAIVDPPYGVDIVPPQNFNRSTKAECLIVSPNLINTL